MGNKVQYFSIEKRIDYKQWVTFQGNPINMYSMNNGKMETIFDRLSITPEIFVNDANDLFNRYHFSIPVDYLADSTISVWTEFTLCVYACLKISNEHQRDDIARPIINELIKNNSRKDVLHSCTRSLIALKYLSEKHELCAGSKEEGKRDSDLIIDKIPCEIKIIEEPEWKSDEDLNKTGEGKNNDAAENICYDIGKFIKNRLFEGIKQADIIFVDFSSKRPFHAEMFSKYGIQEFPELKKNRIIILLREGYDLSYLGTYLDFDPFLWNFMKSVKEEYKYEYLPHKADRDEKKSMAEAEVERISALVPHLLDIPYKKIWIDYDEEADVLYLNFKKPSHADDSELTDDDTVIRYEKGQVVGITFLNARKRREK